MFYIVLNNLIKNIGDLVTHKHINMRIKIILIIFYY